jgi:nucleoid-associated protein YgaU
MYRTAFSVIAMSLLFSGCMTYQTQQQQQTLRTRETENQLLQQENQQRMAGRIETLELEIARLSRELDTQRQSITSLRQSLDSRTASMERQAAEDKRQMIAQLSTQMATLIKQATPTASNSGGHAGASGIEHVVQEGHTLSAIAKAYGVTNKAIIDANNLKHPDQLSVGQKLFIPQ